MQTVDTTIPELDRERWNAWVQKGRRGDALRVARWRRIGALVVVGTALAFILVPVLFRS